GRDRGARTRSYAAAAGMGFGGGRFRTSGHVSAPVGVDESRRSGDRTAVVAVVGSGTGAGGPRGPPVPGSGGAPVAGAESLVVGVDPQRGVVRRVGDGHEVGPRRRAGRT